MDGPSKASFGRYAWPMDIGEFTWVSWGSDGVSSGPCQLRSTTPGAAPLPNAYWEMQSRLVSFSQRPPDPDRR